MTWNFKSKLCFTCNILFFYNRLLLGRISMLVTVLFVLYSGLAPHLGATFLILFLPVNSLRKRKFTEQEEKDNPYIF